MLDTIPPLGRSALSIILLGLLLALIYLASPVLTPLLLAFFLAALAIPGYRWLQAHGVKRGLALFILIVALAVGGLGLLLLALIAVAALQNGLAAFDDQLAMRLADLQAALAQLGLQFSGAAAEAGAGAVSTLMGRLLSAIAGVCSTAVVSMVIVAFLLLELERVSRIPLSDAVKRNPLFAQVPRVARTAVQYFAIRTRLNLVTGIGVSVICLILHIDYALLWGLVAFVLSYVPYIGLATAMIPPALLALAGQGWLQAAVVVITITALNLLIENVLEPSYTGKRLQLSPTIVFISFFFWGWLLGPIGALLSMPITVLLFLVFQTDDTTRSVAALIGREG